MTRATTWSLRFQEWRARGHHHWLLFFLMVAVVVLIGIGLAVYLGDKRARGPSTKLVVTGKEPKVEDNRPSLRATYRDGPPDMVKYSDGYHSGPLRYVTEEAARRIGYRIEWEARSFSASVPGLLDGTVDIIPYVFYKTPEREKDSRFSVSLGLRPRPIYFAINRRFGDHATIKTMKDLTGRRVGHRKMTYYFHEFQVSTDIVKVPFDDDYPMSQAFAQGEVEVLVLNNKQAMERAIASVGFRSYEYADFVFDMKSDMYYMLPKFPKDASRADVYANFDVALQEMMADGTIIRIYKSFQADPPL